MQFGVHDLVKRWKAGEMEEWKRKGICESLEHGKGFQSLKIGNNSKRKRLQKQKRKNPQNRQGLLLNQARESDLRQRMENVT